MPTDTQSILDAAEQIGEQVKQHPAFERYRAAAKTVSDDPEAGRLVADFNRQLETLLRQEQSGMPVTDAQHQQLESLQQRIASHIKMKALHMAQTDFYDLMRKVTQTIQKPLADVAGGGGGGGAGPGAQGGPPRRPAHAGESHDGPLASQNRARLLRLGQPRQGQAHGLGRRHQRPGAQAHPVDEKGDLALVYHTGDERAAVGIAEIVTNPYPDPDQKDEKLVVVDLKPKSKLEQSVTLADIKADPAFAGWDLLRIGRLSVVPVPDAMWSRIEELATLQD